MDENYENSDNDFINTSDSELSENDSEFDFMENESIHDEVINAFKSMANKTCLNYSQIDAILLFIRVYKNKLDLVKFPASSKTLFSNKELGITLSAIKKKR